MAPKGSFAETITPLRWRCMKREKSKSAHLAAPTLNSKTKETSARSSARRAIKGHGLLRMVARIDAFLRYRGATIRVELAYASPLNELIPPILGQAKSHQHSALLARPIVLIANANMQRSSLVKRTSIYAYPHALDMWKKCGIMLPETSSCVRQRGKSPISTATLSTIRQAAHSTATRGS